MRKSLLALAVVAMVLMVGTAMATPVTYTQGVYTATYDFTGPNTITITLGSSPNTNYWVDTVAIQLGGNTVANGGSTSGWTFGTTNNANSCVGTGNWMCAFVTGGGAVAANGLMLTFNFTGTPSGNPSIFFAICGTNAPCGPGPLGGDFLQNFSQSGATQTPEPASLALLGAGLLGLGGLIRRRK